MDQILPCPADPQIHESYLKSADDYVRLAERANGPIERPVSFDYVRGDALAEIECRRRDARIITSGTVPEPKGIRRLRSRQQPRARLVSASGMATRQALKKVSLKIYEREVTACIGPSDCGKTTLLRCRNRSDEVIPDTRLEGRILLDGQDIHAPARI